MPPRDIRVEIANEAAAVHLLLAHYRDLAEGDEDFTSSLIEGESSLLEIADTILAEIGELDDFADALASKIKTIQARKSRFEERSKCLRAALASALEVCQQKTLKRPEATVSIGVGPQTAEIVDESALPSRFFVPQPPKVDKRALLEALKYLKDGDKIEGAELAPGKPKITIRRS